MTGDSKNGGDNNTDDLLSQLLDLEDQPSPSASESNSSNNESEAFGGKTSVDNADSDEEHTVLGDEEQTILGDADQGVDQNDQTEFLIKEEGEAPSNEEEKSTEQSLDELLGFDAPSEVGKSPEQSQSAPASSENDQTEFVSKTDEPNSIDDLLGKAMEENQASQADEVDLFSEDPVEEKTEFVSQPDSSTAAEQRDPTLVLEDPIEDISAQGESKGTENEDSDPIDDALSEFAESHSGEQEPPKAPELAQEAPKNVAAENEEVEVGDLFGDVDESLNADKEVSAEDFSEVFQSGPIQVQDSSSKSKRKSFVQKRHLYIAASILLFVGLLGFGVFQLKSESGILGKRLEGWTSLEDVYVPPSAELRAEFAKRFELAREARYKDDPEEIRSSIEALKSVLAEDRRNIQASASILVHYGRLMAWEGVSGPYPAKFEQEQARYKKIRSRIRINPGERLFQRASAWKALALGEWNTARASFEKQVIEKPSATDEDQALYAELLYRSGKSEEALSHLKKSKSRDQRRAVYFQALIEQDKSRLYSLAQDDYLPALVEVQALGKDLKETQALSELDRVYEKVKDYPWLSVRIQDLRGDLYSSLGEGEKAREEWKAIVDKNPNESRVWAKLAKSYEKDGLWDEAIEAYRSTHKTGGFNRDLAIRFIRLLRSQGKIVEALDEAEKAISAFPKVPDFHYEKGLTQRAIYQDDAAKASFLKALEIDENHEPSILSLANLAMKQQNWQEARDLFSEVDKNGSNYAQALSGLGRLSLATHDLDRAQKMFALAVKKDPKLEGAYKGLIQLLIRSEEEDKALALAEAGISQLPRSPRMHALKARALLEDNKADEAEKVLAPYVEQHSHILDVLFAHAEVLIAQKRFEEARKELDELARQEIQEGDLYYLKALSFYRDTDESAPIIGAKESAWRLVQRALREEPENERYLLLAANIAFTVDEKTEAYEALQKLIRLYPDNPGAYVLQGEMEFENGRTQKAIESFKKASRLTKYDGEIYRKLARVHKLNGNSREAMKYYQRLVKWYPWDAGIHLELGKIYNDQAMYTAARKSFLTAKEKDPRLAEPYYFLGFISKDQGQFKRAQAYFEKYLELKPNAIEAATIRDEIYFLKNSGIQN